MPLRKRRSGESQGEASIRLVEADVKVKETGHRNTLLPLPPATILG